MYFACISNRVVNNFFFLVKASIKFKTCLVFFGVVALLKAVGAIFLSTVLVQYRRLKGILHVRLLEALQTPKNNTRLKEKHFFTTQFQIHNKLIVRFGYQWRDLIVFTVNNVFFFI